jgi:hypothetical protein
LKLTNPRVGRRATGLERPRAGGVEAARRGQSRVVGGRGHVHTPSRARAEPRPRRDAPGAGEQGRAEHRRRGERRGHTGRGRGGAGRGAAPRRRAGTRVRRGEKRGVRRGREEGEGERE